MNTLIWYRNDLRIEDHEPFVRASEEGRVAALYCFDPRQFKELDYGFRKTDSLRAQFLIESIQTLRKKLREVGGELMVRFGKPEEIIPDLVEELEIDQLYYHREVTPEEILVEDSVQNSVEIRSEGYWGHEMYHPDDLPFSLDNIPGVFTQFRKKVEKKGEVRKPLPVPEKVDFVDINKPGEIPDLNDLGLENKAPDDRAVLNFKGGEDEAWKRLNHYFFESDELRNYKFKRNGLLGADFSSKFSPWLANGSISARSIHDQVEKYEKEVHKNVSTYWMKFELIWRDYFRYSARKHGAKIFKLGGIQEKDLDKQTDDTLFEKWKEGETGIPFIDANMRELKLTGYMSNRGRQNVASFLAQNLNFDWRWGAAWFESQLLDYDVCSNWGNWAYNSTVGHDPRNRYFNIVGQAQKYDSDGEYVRHWLPELQYVPDEFVHEPWKMSEDQQKLNECILGEDYPKPMIDLEASYEEIKKRG
ncbi:DASH family cryptochrome [Rhodohalobacter sp.]|uniref:DASH family cryptochrome n=1 Tax=Rhodohalobacter sp. TaxID=1974210 RepID=UPI002ACDCD69|nr:DASH family cryptochrome [Rhodohalobacter sp.]MDZ7756472.1 DASH family cryptochrome [Rhodohalobacter sp.]